MFFGHGESPYPYCPSFMTHLTLKMMRITLGRHSLEMIVEQNNMHSQEIKKILDSIYKLHHMGSWRSWYRNFMAKILLLNHMWCGTSSVKMVFLLIIYTLKSLRSAQSQYSATPCILENLLTSDADAIPVSQCGVAVLVEGLPLLFWQHSRAYVAWRRKTGGIRWS